MTKLDTTSKGEPPPPPPEDDVQEQQAQYFRFDQQPPTSTSDPQHLQQHAAEASHHHQQRHHQHQTKGKKSAGPEDYTIAAALWKPLWPPGWHPRGASVSLNSSLPPSPAPSTGSTGTTGGGVGSGRLNRPRSFLSKYTRHGQLPIITMSEPTDDDAESTSSPDRIPSPKKKGGGHNIFTKHHHTFKKDKHHHKRSNGSRENSSDQISKLTDSGVARSVTSPGSGSGESSDKPGGEGDGGFSRYSDSPPDKDSGRRTPIEDHERMEAWLDDHPAFLRNYFVRKASRSVVDAWLLAHTVPQSGQSGTSSSASAPASGANTPVRKISATEFEKGSLFLRPMVSTAPDGTPTFLPIPPTDGSTPLESPKSIPRKSRKELEMLDEKQLIFELVKDICNDLDVKSLCHKILQNVSIITNADRCSLFLVKVSSNYLRLSISD